jgi:asparagine synthase (glutamine-hydrolysing)
LGGDLAESLTMCGFAGFLAAQAAPLPLRHALEPMSATLVHRGPDDAGVWIDEAVGIGLAHRRLSILDLSPAGHQPMVSASGRFVIAFNGEIYNHLELRRELEISALTPYPTSGGRGGVWRGHSDTETLLAAFDAWGIERTLEKTVGMFAIALWDRETRTLTLARDRLGEKPLYYGWVRGALVFGSELKAIRAFPDFDHGIDRGALALFMRHNYIPSPWSIYEGIWKLPPGCFVQFSRKDALIPGPSPNGRGEITAYWSAREAAELGLHQPFAGSPEEAANELERLLSSSIAGQMIADVPLGAFLSGGIDSSAVVALMQAQSQRPVKTFTIGFHEGEYNEAEHAKAVARHLGTDHTELYVTPEQAMAVIPRLPSLYDEPFADSSQIPTFLVSELARRHVTVSLSGDGGDELFGGYNRYSWAVALWNRLQRVPAPIGVLAARALTALPPARWNTVFNWLKPITPERLRYGNPGDKLHKLASLLTSRQPEAIYRRLISHWDDPSTLVLNGDEPATAITDAKEWLDSSDFEQRMMYLDTITYLPDDILVKVDRAAMGVSLETRVPMLDHRVLEFAWRLPLTMKIREGQGKWLLRQVLHRHVPKKLIERPKMGFGVPIDQWLRGPLRDWAEDYLSEDRLRREGYFHPAPIREKWAEHLSGRRNWSYYLWDVLMFQAWLETVRG